MAGWCGLIREAGEPDQEHGPEPRAAGQQSPAKGEAGAACLGPATSVASACPRLVSHVPWWEHDAHQSCLAGNLTAEHHPAWVLQKENQGAWEAQLEGRQTAEMADVHRAFCATPGSFSEAFTLKCRQPRLSTLFHVCRPLLQNISFAHTVPLCL